MTTTEQMHGHGPIADVPPGFVDAVMRSVAAAPAPSPSRAFTSALRDRSTSEVQGALSVAWRLFRAGATMPVLVRAQALALLLLVGGSVVGAGTIAAVATYQTVVPIVRSVVDPAADDGGLPIPALAEPSPEPTPVPSPTPKPAVAPPDDADVREPAEPMSDGRDADNAPRDDAADDDTDEPDADDPDPDAETGERDDDPGTTEDDPDEDTEEPESDSEDPSDGTGDGDPEGAEATDADDAEPDDSDDTGSDDPGDGEQDDAEEADPDDPEADD